jgi:hypothetical protein
MADKVGITVQIDCSAVSDQDVPDQKQREA